MGINILPLDVDVVTNFVLKKDVKIEANTFGSHLSRSLIANNGMLLWQDAAIALKGGRSVTAFDSSQNSSPKKIRI